MGLAEHVQPVLVARIDGNLGQGRAVELSHFIDTLETCLGKKAERRELPMQPGDVLETCAEIDDLAADVGFAPRTSVEDGVRQFVAWYREYHHC